MLCPRGSKVLNTPPLKLPGGWVGTVTCREEAREAQVCVCGPYGSERSIVMRRGAGEEGGGLAGVSRDLRLGREEPGSGRGRTGGGGPVTSGAGREGSQGRLPALVFGGQGRKDSTHSTASRQGTQHIKSSIINTFRSARTRQPIYIQLCRPSSQSRVSGRPTTLTLIRCQATSI